MNFNSREDRVIFRAEKSREGILIHAAIRFTIIFLYMVSSVWYANQYFWWLGYFGYMGYDSVSFILLTILLAVCIGLWIFTQWLRFQLLFTETKLHAQRGIFLCRTTMIKLNKIDSTVVKGGLIAQIFNYGTVVISSGAGKGKAFRWVKNPYEFCQKLAEQIELNETKNIQKQMNVIEPCLKNMYDTIKDIKGEMCPEKYYPPKGAMKDDVTDVHTRKVHIGEIHGISGEYQGEKISIKPEEQLTIGTDAKVCQLIIRHDEHISRRHCIISVDNLTNRFIVQDESMNGTFLSNGTQLPKGKKVYLDRNTIIQLGRSNNRFLLK